MIRKIRESRRRMLSQEDEGDQTLVQKDEDEAQSLLRVKPS